MAKLSRSFIEATSEAMADENLQRMVGENFPKVEAVVKAAVGINDTDAIAKIILTLIPGLDTIGYKSIKRALDNPITMVLCLKNSTEGEEDEQ